MVNLQQDTSQKERKKENVFSLVMLSEAEN